jgi:hypothetical protein
MQGSDPTKTLAGMMMIDELLVLFIRIANPGEKVQTWQHATPGEKVHESTMLYSGV